MNTRLLLLFVFVFFLFELGCTTYKEGDISNSEAVAWEDLGYELSELSKQNMEPSELLQHVVKPDLDTGDYSDRIELRRLSFDLKDVVEVSNGVVYAVNFESKDRTLIWLGPSEPSTKKAYIIVWDRGEAEFHEGDLCLID